MERHEVHMGVIGTHSILELAKTVSRRAFARSGIIATLANGGVALGPFSNGEGDARACYDGKGWIFPSQSNCSFRPKELKAFGTCGQLPKTAHVPWQLGDGFQVYEYAVNRDLAQLL